MTIARAMWRRIRGVLRSRDALLLGAILALCAAGGATSLGLLHAHLNPGGALVTKLCPVETTSGTGCAAALESRWARISIPVPRRGPGFSLVVRTSHIPVAFLGAAYFAFLGVWFTLLGPARPMGTRWQLLPRATAVIGGLASLGFVGIMALTSAPWCVWCLAVHGINALLLPAVWIATRRRLLAVGITAVGPDAFARLVLTPREALGAVLVAIIAVGGMWGYWRQARIHRHHLDTLRPRAAMINELRSDPAFLLREFAAQPIVMKDAVPLRPSETVADGQPVMLVFSDFECPACRCHASGLRWRMEGEFGDDVRVLFRHYPLCASCNTGVQDAHPNACDAAYAAEAARLQGGEDAFLRMHDALFETGQPLGPGVYAELARSIGLDADRLVRDMETPAVRDLVAADIALGVRLGVKGTPTTLLDGRSIPDVCDTSEFFTAYAERGLIETANDSIVHARPESVMDSVIGSVMELGRTDDE